MLDSIIGVFSLVVLYFENNRTKELEPAQVASNRKKIAVIIMGGVITITLIALVCYFIKDIAFTSIWNDVLKPFLRVVLIVSIVLYFGKLIMTSRNANG